ncbi:hypothetical protein [Gordonia jacobaea]|uniref:hypothetical protein n=1 Tax=Gordonia jacobaea TaxID=122202 RepID=UPI0022DF9C7F|nr:hypothetical protein [Gordonia jacobaea]
MTGPMVWHPQVRLSRGFDVDEQMVDIIEMCFSHGWITRFSCQGGDEMWERKVSCPAYIAFARQDHLLFLDVVAQHLPPNSLEVIGDSPAVYFKPELIPLIERALARP